MKSLFSTKATSQSHADMNLTTARESKTQSLYEEMGGTYTLGADGIYYPDLALPEEEPHYGRYGRMRLHHLKEHRKVLYNILLLDRELVKHLNEVDDTANSNGSSISVTNSSIRIDSLENCTVPDSNLAIFSNVEINHFHVTNLDEKVFLQND